MKQQLYTHTEVDYGLGFGEAESKNNTGKWLALGFTGAASAVILAMAWPTKTTQEAPIAPLTQVIHHELQPMPATPIEDTLAQLTELAQAMTDELSAPDANEVHVNVRAGDSLAQIFQREGFSFELMQAIVDDELAYRHLTKIHPGDQLIFTLDADEQITQLAYPVSDLETLVVNTEGEQPESEITEREIEHMLAFASASISDSLFLAAQRQGLNHNTIMEITHIFGWDIDFALDIQKGDSFSVIYEDRFVDGQRISPGDIVAAEFVNRGNVYQAIRYEDPEGNVDYYTPEGDSMRKAFIRTPVEFTRISSKFNPNRRHPILHTIRAHNGVDYAAPTGTPVRAAGDGKITQSRTNGGYGKVVEIQHGSKYSTLYAHLNGWASGIKEGMDVKQGQVIGYVGMTGMATGPHLHYEFRVDGVHKDPLTVELPTSEPIKDEFKPQFVAHVSDILDQLSDYQGIELAAADNHQEPGA